MRTLSIDLGARRVGLALSDAGGSFATPYEVLEIMSPEEALHSVERVIEKEGVERIVLGLPLNMDDSFGPAARGVVEWGQRLETKTRLPVLYIDERLSSFEADQRLTERKRAGEKMTRHGKKRQLDAIAAAGFLQEFLDGKLAPIHV